jgi:hypothetical protein
MGKHFNGGHSIVRVSPSGGPLSLRELAASHRRPNNVVGTAPTYDPSNQRLFRDGREIVPPEKNKAEKISSLQCMLSSVRIKISSQEAQLTRLRDAEKGLLKSLQKELAGDGIPGTSISNCRVPEPRLKTKRR